MNKELITLLKKHYPHIKTIGDSYIYYSYKSVTIESDIRNNQIKHNTLQFQLSSLPENMSLNAEITTNISHYISYVNYLHITLSKGGEIIA